MFSFTNHKTQRITLTRKFWLWIMVFMIFGLKLFFVGVESGAAQSPIHFTSCVSLTGNNAVIGIPSGAPAIHTEGDLTPEAGDEFAVFRPVGGTCSPTPSLCAGAIVWSGGNSSITVWGDNSETTETDGMIVGEEMCWRVWDSSANNEYVANVAYASGPSTYQVNGISVLDTLEPTVVNLVDFSAKTNPGLLLGGLTVLELVFISGIAFYIKRQHIKNSPSQ